MYITELAVYIHVGYSFTVESALSQPQIIPPPIADIFAIFDKMPITLMVNVSGWMFVS